MALPGQFRKGVRPLHPPVPHLVDDGRHVGILQEDKPELTEGVGGCPSRIAGDVAQEDAAQSAGVTTPGASLMRGTAISDLEPQVGPRQTEPPGP